MDTNPNNQEQNLDKIETGTENLNTTEAESSPDSKSELEILRQKVGMMERLIKKNERTSVDKETAEILKQSAQEIKLHRFAQENGLSISQVEEISKMNGNSNLTKEYLELPAVKLAIEGLKRQERVSNNTPGSGFSSARSMDTMPDNRADRQAWFAKQLGVK